MTTHCEEGSQYFVSLPIADRRIDEHYEEVVRHRMLWRAVIDQVVDDLRTTDFTKDRKGNTIPLTGNKLLEVQRARKHAELWVNGHRPFYAPCASIEDVCDLAGLDRSWVARRVKELAGI